MEYFSNKLSSGSKVHSFIEIVNESGWHPRDGTTNNKSFPANFRINENVFPSIRASHFRSHHCVLIHLVVASMTKKEPLIQRVSFIPTQFTPPPLIWVGGKSNEPSQIINYRKINASTTKPRIWWRAIADGYLCANQEL